MADPIFSDEQAAAIREIMTPVLNGLAGSINKTIKGDREASATAFAKMLDEKLAALKPELPDPEGGGKDGKGKRRDDGETAAMRKTLDDMRKQLEDSAAREKRARDRNVDTTVRQAVYEALGEHGLDQGRAKAAYAAFKLDDRIEAQVDDETESVSIMFREDDGTQVPLRDGVKRWTKTEPAKLYLPPSGARGAGTRPGTPRQPNGQPISKDQVEANAMGYLAKALKNAGVVAYAGDDTE